MTFFRICFILYFFKLPAGHVFFMGSMFVVQIGISLSYSLHGDLELGS